MWISLDLIENDISMPPNRHKENQTPSFPIRIPEAISRKIRPIQSIQHLSQPSLGMSKRCTFHHDARPEVKKPVPKARVKPQSHFVRGNHQRAGEIQLYEQTHATKPVENRKIARNMRMNAGCFHWDRDFLRLLENISCSHFALRPYYLAMQSATAVPCYTVSLLYIYYPLDLAEWTSLQLQKTQSQWGKVVVTLKLFTLSYFCHVSFCCSCCRCYCCASSPMFFTIAQSKTT